VGLARYFPLRGRAVEVPHPRCLVPSGFVRQVHAAKGVVYVFLTAIPFVKALDAEPGSPDRERIFEILDRGVDGIMTDRPAHTRKLIDEWIAQRRNSDSSSRQFRFQ
jgi:glycerophosphoryl diester phosphodiesterase